MARGRKAMPGTVEAKAYVNTPEFVEVVASMKVSKEAQDRILKAIKFALGVK